MRRLTYLLGLSAALHLYIGARIVPPLPGAGAWRAVRPAAGGFGVAGADGHALAAPRQTAAVGYAGLGRPVFLGLFSSLFVLTVLRDVLLLLGWIVSLIAPHSLPLESLRTLTAAAVPLLGIAVTFIGFLNARRTAQVKTVEIPLAGLPEALHGFTIVQISDVHVGPTIRARYVEGIVKAVNRLEPDLVAITGDLVDGSVPELGAQVAPLARLASQARQFLRHRQPRVLLGRGRRGWSSCAGWASRCCTTSMW